MVKDPFFCMNLICPSTSYDVNIEPAKDDILFVNVDSVISIFERFLKSVYGELREPPAVPTQSRFSDQRPRGFDVLLARKSQSGSKMPKQIAHKARPADRNEGNAAYIPSAGFKLAHTVCDGLPPLNNSQDGSVQDHEEARLDGRNFQAIHPAAVAVAVALPDGASKSVTPLSAAEQRRGWQRDMYGAVEDNMSERHGPQDDDSQLQDSQGSDEENGLRDASVSNPWVFAKLNASARRSNIAKGAVANVESNNQLLTPRRHVGELGKATARQVHEILRDPDIPNFGLPTPARDKGYQATSTTSQNSSSPEPLPFPGKHWGKSDRKTTSSKHTSSRKMNSDCGALDTWMQKPMGSRSVTTHSAGPSDGDMQDPNVPLQTPTRGFVSARALNIGTPLKAILEGASKSTRKGAPGKQTEADINELFVSAVNGPSRVRLEVEPKGKDIRFQPASAQSVADAIAADRGIRFDREDQDSVSQLSPTRSISPVHPDLAATMDYEIRKQAALQHWKANQRRKTVAKDFVPNSEDEPSPSFAKTSPHQNRYNRAVANLHSPGSEAALPEPQLPSFESGDPRAYLLHAQEYGKTNSHDFPNDSSNRPRNRRKTGLLPLETVPEDRSTCNLILTLGREELGLKRRLRPGGTSFCDEYISSGTTVDAFSSCTIHQIRAWEAKLSELVGSLRCGTEEDDGVVNEKTDCLRLDIWTSLQTHRATTHTGCE